MKIFLILLLNLMISLYNNSFEITTIHGDSEEYNACNLYILGDEVFNPYCIECTPGQQCCFSNAMGKISEVANPGMGIITYQWEGVDIYSLQVLFLDENSFFSGYPCYYKDKNYVYGMNHKLFFPFFSGFDYETLEVMTGIVDFPNRGEKLTTCQFGGCFKDKNAVYYPEGGGMNSNFFITDFVRNENTTLPPESNYDPFKRKE